MGQMIDRNLGSGTNTTAPNIMAAAESGLARLTEGGYGARTGGSYLEQPVDSHRKATSSQRNE